MPGYWSMETPKVVVQQFHHLITTFTDLHQQHKKPRKPSI